MLDHVAPGGPLHCSLVCSLVWPAFCSYRFWGFFPYHFFPFAALTHILVCCVPRYSFVDCIQGFSFYNVILELPSKETYFILLMKSLCAVIITLLDTAPRIVQGHCGLIKSASSSVMIWFVAFQITGDQSSFSCEGVFKACLWISFCTDMSLFFLHSVTRLFWTFWWSLTVLYICRALHCTFCFYFMVWCCGFTSTFCPWLSVLLLSMPTI